MGFAAAQTHQRTFLEQMHALPIDKMAVSNRRSCARSSAANSFKIQALAYDTTKLLHTHRHQQREAAVAATGP